jgi:hypothetical protein
MYARRRKPRPGTIDPAQTIMDWIDSNELADQFDIWLTTVPSTVTKLDYLPFVMAHNAPPQIIDAAHTVMEPVIWW